MPSTYTVYLLEDSVGCTPPQEHVMPVEVFIDLGSLLQVAGVPVIWQLVLANQVGHDCCTTCTGKNKALDENKEGKNKLRKETDLSARQNPLSLIAGTCLFGLVSFRSSLVIKSPVRR